MTTGSSKHSKELNVNLKA